MTAKLFTDEDVYAAVAVALRKAGTDAISTPESGRLGETDESQLAWATADGRAIVTMNVADFAALHDRWLKRGLHHAGIVVSQQRPIGDMIRRLSRLANTLDSESLRDRLEFLGNW